MLKGKKKTEISRNILSSTTVFNIKSEY